jgi:hypothetical protein
MFGNLALNVAVLLSNIVDLTIEHVHIVVEGVVLLFSLNEGSHDLFS